MSDEGQRKFLHDLANSLSIVDASVSRVLTLLMRNHPELVDEINRLKKTDEYSKKSILALNEFRQYVQSQNQE
jgi:hypothetical protein